MKKLLLILALALSANAWGEMKSLDCFRYKDGAFETEAETLTFDPKLPNAEVKVGNQTLPATVQVFPTHYRFTWSITFAIMDSTLDYRLDLNREDLSYFKWQKLADSYTPSVETIGMCKLVEIDTSKNIL